MGTPQEHEDPLADGEVTLEEAEANLPRHLSPWRRRGGHLLSSLLLVLTAAGALFGSLLYHLQLPSTRSLGAQLASEAISGLIAGRLEIGAIDSLSLWKLHATDIAFFDPNGEEVISGDALTLRYDLLSLLDGTLRFTHARLDGGSLRLIENAEGLPTFLDGFAPLDTEPSEGGGLDAFVEDMHLDGVSVSGAVLGFEGLEAEGVHAHMRMAFEADAHDGFLLQVFHAGGQVVGPYPFAVDADDLRARISGSEGTWLWTRAQLPLSPEQRAEGAAVEEARVELRLTNTDDGGSHLDLQARIDNLRGERLAEAGQAWAEGLQGPLSGPIHLQGPTDDLRLRSWLQTAGGDFEADASLPSDGPIEVEIRTGAIDVGAIHEAAPAMVVAGSARIVVPPDGDPSFEAELDPFDAFGFSLPGLSVAGRFTESGVSIDNASLADAGNSIEVSGNVDGEGNTQLRVRGRVDQVARESNLRDLVPGVRASVRFDSSLTLRDGGQRIDMRGRWILRNVSVGALRADLIVAEGRIFGAIDAPQIDLSLENENVRVAGEALGDGPGRVSGGPERFALSLSLGRAPQSISFDAELALGDTIQVEVPQLTLVSPGYRWQGAVQGIRYHPARASVQRFVLRNGRGSSIDASARVRLAGRPRTDESDHLNVELTNLPMEALAPWLGERMPDADGVLSGRLELEGSLRRSPIIHGDGSLTGGRLGALENLEADWLLDYRDGNLQADASVGTTASGSERLLNLFLTGLLDPSEAPIDALEHGVYELVAETSGFPLQQLTSVVSLPEDFPAITGVASGRLQASGSIDFFDFHGDLRVPRLELEELVTLGVDTQFSFRDGALIAHVITRDSAGDLLEAEGSISLPLPSVLADPTLLLPLLDTAPWRLAARLPRRILGRLPHKLARLIPHGDALEASANLTLSGGAFGTRGDLLGRVEWRGDIEDDGTCGQHSRPLVHIDARLRGDTTEVRLAGITNGQEVVEAHASASTPIERWLNNPESFRMPATTVEANVRDLHLESIPVLCERAAGPIDAAIVADNLLTDAPWAQLELHAEGVRLRRSTTSIGARHRGPRLVETEAFNVTVKALAADGIVGANTNITWWDGGSTTLEADAPIVWNAETPVPSIGEEGELHAHAELHNTPLDAALFWVPGFGNVSGSLEGSVTASGEVASPSLTGAVDLTGGRIELPSFGQRLEDTEGTFIFEGERVALQGLRARDGEGLVHMAGDIAMDGIFPESLDLRIDATDFPVRQEGSVIASLTGTVGLAMAFGAKRLEGELRVDTLDVYLPEGVGRATQPLHSHPDIELVGAQPNETFDSYAIALHVDASTPFKVQSDDFGAVVAAELDVLFADPSFRVGGQVTIEQGSLELYGKRFDVREGSMRFDANDEELNPVVNLVAVHPLRSRPGETVTVTATGTLAQPRIGFASTITNDDASIIALLVSGQVREDSFAEASQRTQDFLIGVASGVLTLSLREEFGRHFPAVVFRGNEYGGTRIGAGYSFDDLIPDWMQRVVTGIYVEGYLNTRSDAGATTTGQVQDYGFLLELSFPRDVVWSTTYAPPSSGKIDLTWQP